MAQHQKEGRRFHQISLRSRGCLLFFSSGHLCRRFVRLFDLHVAKPLAEVTARKEVKWVRQIVKIGVKKKYIPSNPMEGFKCSGGDVEVIPLEFWQVGKIQQKLFRVDRIAEVRDAFIFQCFTGFAYQDIYDLSPENIVLVGPKRERWLVKHRRKTEVGEMVPILPIVDQLISKYQDI